MLGRGFFLSPSLSQGEGVEEEEEEEEEEEKEEEEDPGSVLAS